jgi:adenylosuccinate synthase
MKKAKPVWEELEGWDAPLSSARKLADLPINAQRYIRRLEEILETEMVLASVGPSREQTIMFKDPFAP